MRRATSAVLRALAATCAVSACNESAGPDTSYQVASVVVTPRTRTFTALGDSMRLVAEARNSGGETISPTTFAWSSLASDVASVDQRGMVTALKVGSALVVASASGKSDTATINVSQIASRVVITPEADTINAVGDTVTFAVVVADANGFAMPNPVVVWRATPPAVVAITNGGVVSLTTGTAAVIATAGTRADTVQVLSRQIAATLELAHPLPALVVGESFQIPATAADSNGVVLPPPEVDFISAAPSVMSVSADGVMRGESVGPTTITISVPGLSLEVAARVIQPLGSIGERIGAGAVHSCALNVAGEAYCWGSFSSFPGPSELLPLRVTGDHIFNTIAANSYFACALTPNGAAYCWGWNYAGQLGDGTTQRRSAPVRVIGAPALASITVGYAHACGLTEDGAAYCWGRHPSIPVDPDNLDPRGDLTAQPVEGGMVFRSISAGTNYTCGVTRIDIAYCWGVNYDGELGDGTTERRSVARPVAGNLRFTDVRAGERHSCGITTDGATYCWGFNEAGQLGDGTQTSSLVPVAVAGGHLFASVEVGRHTCAVTALGAGYCWGYNFSGQLGNGWTGPDECSDSGPICAKTPQPVSGGLAFAKIFPGYFRHSCGRTLQGAIYCWGANDFGQIGNGARLSPYDPQQHVPVRVHLP